MAPLSLTRCAAVLCALLLAAGVLGACGDDDSDSSGGSARTSTQEPATSADAKAFAGGWQTTFGELRLEQSAAGVEGTYDFCAGTLTGTPAGNKLEGSWDEDTGACENAASAARDVAEGTFSFTLDAGGDAFTGHYVTNGSAQRKPWNGRRIVP